MVSFERYQIETETRTDKIKLDDSVEYVAVKYKLPKFLLFTVRKKIENHNYIPLRLTNVESDTINVEYNGD